MTVLAVALGGLLGAPTRFAVDRFVADRVESSLPWGTIVINLSGALLLGVLTGLGLAGLLPGLFEAFLGIGFCGAFTTFSTWSFETVALLRDGEVVEAVTNALGSLVLGLVAAGAGIALGLHL